MVHYGTPMGKATGNISQKPISVKLNREQIAVLDYITELGSFNGRSHTIREFLMPAFDASIEAMKTGKGYQGLLTYATLVKKGFGKRFDTIAENAKERKADPKGQAQLDIPNIPDDFNFKPFMGKELLEEN